MRTFLAIAAFALLGAGVLWLLRPDGVEERRRVPDSGLPTDVRVAGGGLGDAGRGTPGLAHFTGPPQGAATVDPGWLHSGRTVTIHGRVLDSHRLPVARVSVQARLAGRSIAGGHTRIGGDYDLSMSLPRGERPRHGFVMAHTESGLVGMAVVRRMGGASGRIVVPAIVLQPAAELRLHVVHNGRPAAGARVVLAARVAGVPTPLTAHVTDPAGTLTVKGLARTVLEIFASSPRAGRGHMQVTLPQLEGHTAELRLLGVRSLGVRVMDAQTGLPVRGADVLIGDRWSLPLPSGPGYLPPIAVPRTDAEGRTTVEGLGVLDTLYVGAHAQGYALAPWHGDPSRTLRPGQGEVEIRLQPSRTVRFPVSRGDVEPPGDGSILGVRFGGTVRGDAAYGAQASMQAGMLVLRGLPAGSLDGVVISQEGMQAAFTVRPGAQEGAGVVFTSGGTVDVQVVRPDGRAVSGLRLRLIPEGEPMGTDTGTTDESGHIAFHRPMGSRVSIHRVTADRPEGGPRLATLDLTGGREVHRIELPAVLDLILHVRLDGTPGLPARYTLWAGGQTVPPEDIREDPEAGVLRAFAPLPGRGHPLLVRLVAEGYGPVEGDLGRPAVDAVLETNLDLRAGIDLLVRVARPRDGRYALRLDEWSPTVGAWTSRGRPGLGGRALGSARNPASDETHRFRGLGAGRYRVIDVSSFLVSEPVDLEPGATSNEVFLDLSRVRSFGGRVLGPPGGDLTQARVHVEEPDAASQARPPIRPARDGTFQLRAEGGHRLTLGVTHPALRSAEVGGRITAQAGRDPLELRLEAGTETRFQVPALERAGDTSRHAGGPLADVRLFRGRPSGPPLHGARIAASLGTFTFGGYEPGTYTLWIGLGSGHAPVVLEGVELGRGVTELGTLRPSRGAVVRVRLRAAAGRALPKMWMRVKSLGRPAYERRASRSPGSGVIVCSGLGTGRFVVTVHSVSGGSTGPLLERQIEIESEGEVVLDLDIP